MYILLAYSTQNYMMGLHCRDCVRIMCGSTLDKRAEGALNR